MMRNSFTFCLALAVFLLTNCGSPEDRREQTKKAATIRELPMSVTYTQIVAGADGETHFRDVTLPLTATVTSPPAQPLGVSDEQPATTIRFASFQPHWGDYDRDNHVLHTVSSPRFISVIQGDVWVRTSDGETRRFRRGDVFEALDAPASRGHTTWVGEEPALALFSNHS